MSQVRFEGHLAYAIAETCQRRQGRVYARTVGGLQLSEPSEADLEACAFDLARYNDLSNSVRGAERQLYMSGQVKAALQMEHGATERSLTDLLDPALCYWLTGPRKTVVVHRAARTNTNPVTQIKSHRPCKRPDEEGIIGG